MKIAILLVNFAGGGAERAAVMLANGLAGRGHQVVIAVASDSGPHRSLVQDNVTVRDLGAGRAYKSIFKFVSFLKKERPVIVLSYMVPANTIAAIAKLFYSKFVLIGVEQGSMHNGYHRDRKHLFQRLAYLAATWTYSKLNLLVCVDDSAALAASAFTRRPDLPVKVMPNPVIDTTAACKLQEPAGHPWLDNKDMPVFINVGRLTYQKNQALLLDAFEIVRRSIACRLIILGEGELRASLNSQAKALGIADSVSFPGFATNPFAWLSKSDVFVLSSRWEGLPTVLIEAAFAGLPIVSTKASFGTIELAGYGKHGQLVSDYSATTLAESMLAVLDAPPSREVLKASARKYEIDEVAQAYESLFIGREERASD